MSINIPTQHSSNIAIPIGKLETVIEWCKKNCTGEWKFDNSEWDSAIPDYNFYFESERDYVAFLMWNK